VGGEGVQISLQAQVEAVVALLLEGEEEALTRVGVVCVLIEEESQTAVGVVPSLTPYLYDPVSRW